MPVNPYLTFQGNCREAVMYYAKVFETSPPQIMTFGDTPPHPDFTLPEEAGPLVMHTNIQVCGTMLMFSDAFPGTPFVAGNNVSLALVHTNMDEIKTYFERLKEEGTVRMELQETFWSKCYGSVVDKFGMEWQFNYQSDECEV
ncbi:MULTISPECIES: VOC family protein [Brevibacillus]|jgi:PhnB protein|uniref:VOC family protein n=1 Tax=Brevibacillus TaxID=55080 RepID=UPI0026174826|nr:MULTISPECIES: VOC family protein [Brevibacillus]MED1949508.1 VOC family protein [Brevibacillus centrosporus]